MRPNCCAKFLTDGERPEGRRVNKSSPRELWFWERITSPHVAGLLGALARSGCRVTYVAEMPMLEDRVLQGWAPPSLDGVNLHLVRSREEVWSIVNMAPPSSIHICDGVRGNGLANVAQVGLASRGLRQWVAMETVDDSGWRGVAKRLEYRRLFWKWGGRIQGVLATGAMTADWVRARGLPIELVYPFAYFLSEPERLRIEQREPRAAFQVIFVGALIPRKRVDLLIAALARIPDPFVELTVVGGGELESMLKSMAEAMLPGRVTWTGTLPMGEAQAAIAKADCLVLPSRHDGWGAVVSEALMAGTPVICSEGCGTAVVVRASGHGGVFESGSVAGLADQLTRIIARGRLSDGERDALADWAQCLGAEAGAKYLLRVLDHADGRGARPEAPWAATRTTRGMEEVNP